MTSAPPTKSPQKEDEAGSTLVWHRLLVAGGLILAALLVGVLLRYRNLMWAAPSTEASGAVTASSGAIATTTPPKPQSRAAEAPATNGQAAAQNTLAASSSQSATPSSSANRAPQTAANSTPKTTAANPAAVGKPAKTPAPSTTSASAPGSSPTAASSNSARPNPSGATRPTAATTATATKPATPAKPSSQAASTAPKAGSGSLADARKLADPTQASKLRQAILVAQKIQPGTPEHKAAQGAIADWNQQIWSLADRRAQQGQFQTAIAAAKLVADNPSTLKRQAQQAIPHWQTLQAATALLQPGQASTYNRAIEKVRQIQPGQPGYAQAQQLIGQWSQQIMMLAESRASRGQVRDAIAAAYLVPSDSPLHSSAQTAIARWKTRIGVL